MNSNAQAPPSQNTRSSADVTVVLIQHWADMVDRQREDIANANRQIRAIDARATRLYNDNLQLHGLFNESEAELHYHQNQNQRFSLLIVRILLENPQLSNHYTQLYHAMIDGTEENPIDLTTAEELDQEM